MADTQISALVADVTLHTDDLLVVVDTHDTSMASSGTDKKLTPSQLFAALTGDVTYSGFGGTISNGAVTLPKLANGTANNLIGFSGTGVPTAISAGANVTISGGVISASGGGGSGSPGGSSGTIQYNASGSFGGFTASGDAAINTTSGAVTVSAIGGQSVSLAGAFATSGAFSTTLTVTANTNVTLPTSGTLVNTAVTTLSSLSSVGTISSGTWHGTAIAPQYGGTGLGTLTAHAVLLGEGTSNVAFAATGTAGRLLIDQGAAADPSFNAMAGDATITSGGTITVTKTNGVAFAASATTDTTNASNIASGTLAAARLPNPSASTLGGIESYLAVSHQWINAISTSGVPSSTQPAFTDISGSVAASQLPNPSSSTLGGVQSYAGVTHQWINSISTSGVPSSTQPAFTDISGSVAVGQLPTVGLTLNEFISTITTDTDGSTVTFDLSVTNWHQVTLGGNRTLALSNGTTGQQFTIVLIQDGTGSRTVTWFSGIKWPGGSAPTLTTTASKADVFTFKQTGAGAYYGFVAGQNF